MTFQIGAQPVVGVARAALRFQREAGLHVPRRPTDFSNVAISQQRSDQMGDAYGRLASFDRGALPAFHAMRDEVRKQFDFMTRPERKGGMGIHVGVTKDDPYGKDGYHTIFNEMADDLNHNNRLNVLSTASTGGHPLFSNDENDMFRAVHDVFGHLGTGRGVDRHGEDAAYQKHAEMFTPLARRALGTETRGQNAALHRFGDFQDQKVALLPDHMLSPQFHRGGVTGADRALARQKNVEQGISRG